MALVMPLQRVWGGSLPGRLVNFVMDTWEQSVTGRLVARAGALAGESSLPALPVGSGTLTGLSPSTCGRAVPGRSSPD
jgi:hypothetical protein